MEPAVEPAREEACQQRPPPESVTFQKNARKLCPFCALSKDFTKIPHFHKNLTVGTHSTNPLFIDFTR